MGTLQLTCRICGTIGNHSTFIGREMMFGTREEFEYFQCGSCDCLQIAHIPENLGQYYPSSYPANKVPTTPTKEKNWVTRALEKQRSRTALFNKHHKLNRLLKILVDYPNALHTTPNDVFSIASIIKTAGITSFNASILDVGCGTYSYWLASLEKLGFTNLLGIDPLIPADQMHGRIRVTQTERHHTTKDDNKKHNPNKPTQEKKEYGANWVELDPPRHLYLHSIKSLKLLAEKAGLVVFDIQYDSLAFEFYGSEMYARGIPLIDENSPWVNPKSTLFTDGEMEHFKALAKKANSENQGGRAAFFLRKANR